MQNISNINEGDVVFIIILGSRCNHLLLFVANFSIGFALWNFLFCLKACEGFIKERKENEYS